MERLSIGRLFRPSADTLRSFAQGGRRIRRRQVIKLST